MSRFIARPDAIKGDDGRSFARDSAKSLKVRNPTTKPHFFATGKMPEID
jgi:hypothetical protein